MVDRFSRQARYLYRFFSIVEEHKQIVTSCFTERAVLSPYEVIPAPATVVIRMRGFNPRLTGFDLYGVSPGRGDIEDRDRVYRDIQDSFCDALSGNAVLRGAGIGIQGLHDNLSARWVYIGVVLVMGRVI